MSTFEPKFLNLEYFFNLIYRFFAGVEIGAPSPQLISGLKVGLFFLIFVFGLIVAMLVIRITTLRREEIRDFVNLLETDSSAQKIRNKQWEKVQTLLVSESQSEWKQAIIEADNLLDEMVRAMNYPGDNLGERLKNIEPSDFTTLQSAWEAHKVRNQIAHQNDFTLTRREVGRVLELYEKVFREFNFI
ncbi:MAG: hypothetical protein AAB415_02585 [Patescibacteria group bacterium]